MQITFISWKCIEQVEQEIERDVWSLIYTTVPAFDAIRGHRSAYSLRRGRWVRIAMRPGVRMDAHILLLQGRWWQNPSFLPSGWRLHRHCPFSKRVKINSIDKMRCSAMTYLKVEENTISPTPCFALTDNDDGHSWKMERISSWYRGSVGSTNIGSLPLLSPPNTNTYSLEKNSLFFLSSGLPFLTDAMIISPTPASGSLLRWAPQPNGPIKKMDLAPLLSAQLRTAPTGRPRVRRNFVPAAPPPIRHCSLLHRFVSISKEIW